MIGDPHICHACDRGNDAADPLLEAYVSKDRFWICRDCVEHWLRAAWPDRYWPEAWKKIHRVREAAE